MVSTFQCHKKKQAGEGWSFFRNANTCFSAIGLYPFYPNAEKYCHRWAHFIAWSAKHPLNASSKQVLISAPVDWGDLNLPVFIPF